MDIPATNGWKWIAWCNTMEITELSGARYDLAIKRFREGMDSLLYEEVLFVNNGTSMTVNSYSDWHLDRTTEVMARAKIERSKDVLIVLSRSSQEFREIESELPKEFVFCCDYHAGAVMLAREIDGEFQWHRPF